MRDKRERGWKEERKEERERESDVGKEEANQKRKYGPARPEALRESGRRPPSLRRGRF